MININPFNNNSPSFSAQFVMKVPIQKYSNTDRMYKTFMADLIKFDKKSPIDLDIVGKICENDEFSPLGKYLIKMWHNKLWNIPCVQSNSVYALVKPQESADYSEITPDDTFGITEFVEPLFNQYSPNQIMYMITKQSYRKNDCPYNSQYTNIGKGITDALKTLYPHVPIYVFSEYEATEFWQKQGFTNMSERRMIYYG